MNTFSKILICLGYIMLFGLLVSYMWAFDRMTSQQKDDVILYQLMQQQ
jgi:FtsZ-interacting cell division protein ZipA